MKKLTSLLLSALAASTFAADVTFWPRLSPAVMPTELQQLVVLEFSPDLDISGEATVTMTLPPGIEFAGIPQAWVNPDKPNVYALPSPAATAYPTSAVQEEITLTLKFPAGAFEREELTRLPMIWNVRYTPAGTTSVKIDIKSDSAESTRELPLEIAPPLTGRKSAKPLIAWNFQGLEEQFLPTYLNALTQAGVNRVYEMREETPNRKSVVDLGEEFGTIHGTSLFGERIGKYFKDNGLPAELADRDDVIFDNAWLLDNPDVMEVLLSHYIDYLTDGKKFDVVVYDAERGAFKSNGKTIVGDLTEYSLQKFGAQFNIPAAELTPEIITEKYQAEWIKYCCDQSLALATIAARVTKEKIPGATFEVYSGYEYDLPPHKDLTRRNYAVDWKSMATSGMDAAGAGYFGSPEDIMNTARALGDIPYLPAEMYMDGFASPGDHTSRIEWQAFSARLIRSFLLSGAHGVQIWYGSELDGNALVALDRYTAFVNLLADSGAGEMKPYGDDFYQVLPGGVEMFTYATDTDSYIIALNANRTARRLNREISLPDMTVLYNITDSTQFTAPRFLRYELRPFSYVVWKHAR